MAIRQGDTRRLLSRRGNDLLHWFPEIAAEFEKLPNLVIEGELVMLDARGHSEFHKLRGRCAIRDPRRIEAAARAHPAAVFAFDLLAVGTTDMRAPQ